MKTIQWGIIGCGDVTEVKSGPAFNKVPDSRLVAVMRRNSLKAEDYARRHNVPRWYNDAQQLINDPAVNAVYVATPPLYHEDYTIQALKAGKPVYVEKPMALNAVAAESMHQVAEETGVPLTVAHYRREQPLFLKVKSLLQERAIGDIRLAQLQLWQPQTPPIVAQTEENWRIQPGISGGGLFHDFAPHQLDLMYYFFGKPDKASGISFNQAGWYDADDVISGQIVFEKGILCTGTWSFSVAASEKRDICEIVGSEGSIYFPIFENRQFTIRKNGQEEAITFSPLEHVQQPMIAKVVQYFLGKGPNPCSAEEGVEVMKLMEAFTKKKG
ncbi:MAG: Gfo/Idh/MocA family oxidoreductase [Flavisolibacter sp.]|nr:Gfo/Idh/MocA family oxidoreductase [Flavisolibacter sp.]